MTIDPTMTRSAAASDEVLALARVRKLKGFYIHLVIYFAVISALTAINLLAHRHTLWVIYPALGWGIGLLALALVTFDRLPFLTAAWERRKVEQYLGRKL